ncbi:hypothetical protein A3306_00020 [Rickettsia bellii]|uniref:Uncharacterized protein n=2 Tax=Rickettsia bellii TaxID=33990 RepID=A0A0F3QIZ1_RICBE|nr:hypothetical protein [Rickettsia bellii]ABV79391.1 hypothetical protein A1I_05320 [Rickettsia bellii OSU 85-389]ARD85702.1 hypothetical protein A3306_00020 [Rickettsia bellii]KJV89328.1 hypothetical protein RBEAN4_0300 [Rickettsia bellii str. RML An4]KJV92106.1 hypothetical protein RBEMOGI_0727 [Rickettsia bellii str. RML Mogi]
MSKDKSDNSGPSNFISDFISSIGRAVCESTKESYGDKCPHDVNVGGNVYNPGGEPESNVRGTEY